MRFTLILSKRRTGWARDRRTKTTLSLTGEQAPWPGRVHGLHALLPPILGTAQSWEYPGVAYPRFPSTLKETEAKTGTCFVCSCVRRCG